MTARDALGFAHAGADASAVERYQAALRGLQCFTGDPVAEADAAITTCPDFTMAHVIKGWLYGLSTEKAAMPVLRACHEAAVRTASGTLETGHVVALGHLANGRWHEAGRVLEDLSIEHPHDALALQAGHQIDFFTGNARMLRDRIARALPTWDESVSGYHAILGMHAFGLEETGDYARAEAEGRRAVELEPRDGWAQHAVAHVMEMQCRQRDGICWMRANPDNWTRDSFLQIHNWWHLALFHFELGDTDEVLALYDGPVYGERSTIALNMVDASSLLWRLHLAGVDVGDRWNALAGNWAPLASSGHFAFNDMHAMMAFVGAGRAAEAAELLAVQQETMAGASDNAAFTREVGHPVCKAILAFGEGNYRRCVELVRPIRRIANRFGGSHAQRDVIDLTLIEAALRGGNVQFARALTAERFDARPESPLSQLFVRRARDFVSQT